MYHKNEIIARFLTDKKDFSLLILNPVRIEKFIEQVKENKRKISLKHRCHCATFHSCLIGTIGEKNLRHIFYTGKCAFLTS